MKTFGLTLALLFTFYGLFSQTPKQMDSLERLLTSTSSDSVRIAIQRQLYLGYYDSLPKKAARVTRDMISRSMKSGYEKGTAGGHYLLGHLYVTSANYDSANYHLRKSLEIGIRTMQPNISLNALEWIANVHQKKGNLDSALLSVQRAVRIADENSAISGEKIARIKMNEGRIYDALGKYEEAVNTYVEAEKALPDGEIGLRGTIKAWIGNLYYRLERDEKAKEYFIQAQAIFKETSDRNGYYTMENKLGNIEQAADNLVAAEKHYLTAYAHFESVNGFSNMATIGSNLGYIYLSQKKYDLSKKYFEESTALAEKTEQISLLPYSYNGLGELYRKTNNLDKAVASYKKAIDLAEKKGATSYLTDSYTFLIEAYGEMSDFKNAYEHQASLIRIKDSMHQKSSLERISAIEAQYQNEKQEQEIALLTSQAQLAEQKTKNQRNLFLAGISVLGLALITMFVLFKNKQRTNLKLKQLEAAKSKFFANISHEFRTPLTLISGPVAHQLSKEGLSSDDKTDLGLIQRNASRLLKLVNQILDLSKIEAGSRKLRVSKGNMELFLKHLIEPFHYQATQRDMAFKSEIDIPEKVWFDRDVIEKVVSNLLSNALKYNPNGGRIDFKAVQEDQQILITTVNENNDLTEKELPLLFDRFYQNNAMHQGFGIGLSLVQELAILSHGTIHAYKPDAATIAFEVSLPVSKNAFSKADVSLEDGAATKIQKPKKEVLLEQNNGEEQFQESSLPVLLVVDDNAEIRLFIKTLFKKEYQILEAENGEEGINSALKTIPDLVISDIMMPVKDGIHLSHTLKNDERTSHIPIVLLTAKSGEENELTGLKTGADAYMVKPFKEEKLRVVIEKLIATREAIREKLNKQVILSPKEVKLTSADAKLISRIRQILDMELTNPEFNASAFSEQIGLSRMHLHRKLKALTGLSTSEFIRVQRLKLAAKLLKEGHSHISEVGYSVGFNQPAYFATAFKKQFDCSPSEYVNT
ncbi:tetratricopeptide repeat protein [Flavobacteriaceae bacterium 3-367]